MIKTKVQDVLEVQDKKQSDSTIYTTKNYYLTDFRGSGLVDVARYIRQYYKQEKHDTLSVLSALQLLSLMNRNKFKIIEHNGHETRLSLWTLTVGQTGVAKSDMCWEICKLCKDSMESYKYNSSKNFLTGNTLSDSGFVEQLNSVDRSQGLQYLLRVDEFKSFDDNPQLRKYKNDMMSWKAGETFTSTYVKHNNNKDKGKGNGNAQDYNCTIEDFQFNIFSQTTVKRFFSQDRSLDIEGGFLNRFLVVYDSYIDKTRGIKLKDPRIEKKIIEQQGREYTREEIEQACYRMYRNIKNAEYNTLSIDENTAIYFADMMYSALENLEIYDEELCISLNQRISELVYIVAGLIELSHLPDREDNPTKEEEGTQEEEQQEDQEWENTIDDMLNDDTPTTGENSLDEIIAIKEEQQGEDRIYKNDYNAVCREIEYNEIKNPDKGKSLPISKDSIRESFSFVWGEFLRWYGMVNQNLNLTKSKVYIEKIESMLKRRYDTLKRDYKDSNNNTIQGVSYSDIKRYTHLDENQITWALSLMLQSGTVGVYDAVAGNGRILRITRYFPDSS